jgi:hypothetical protein
MLKETIVSINHRRTATSTWKINTCAQKWSSKFKYEQNDKEWEMHAISSIAEVKYYKILQSQKRKGGDKACIVLHIDRNRQSSTVPPPHHRRPPLKEKPKAHVPFYNIQDHQVRGTRNLRSISKTVSRNYLYN